MRKILHTFLSLIIIAMMIIVPARQAQANAFGVSVTSATLINGTNGAVNVAAAIGGVARMARIIPTPPQITALILAGAGGAWVGDYLYQKYGSDLVDWAIDKSGNIDVNLRNPVSGCTDNFGYGISATNAQDLINQVAVKRGWSNLSPSVSGNAVYAIMQGGSSLGLVGYCNPPTTKATDSASAAANAAKASADTNANARALIEQAAAANAKPDDFTKNPDAPADPSVPFDPSSIIAAIQSLFTMLQGLLQSVLAAITAIPQAIADAADLVIASIKDMWDWFKTGFESIKTTYTTAKDAVVNEYEHLTDVIAKEYVDARDWIYSKDDIAKDKDPANTNVDVSDSADSSVDTSINFGSSCPANIQVPWGLPGRTTDITIMDFSKFCVLLSTYLKPIVIAIASYQAVRILGGSKE